MNDDFFQDNNGFTSGTTTYITQHKVNNKKKGKSNKAPFIISGVIILAAIITTGVFFLLSNNKKDKSQVGDTQAYDSPLDDSPLEKLTKDIISTLEHTDLTAFKNHMYPPLLEYYIDHYIEDGMIAHTFMFPFLIPEFEFLDYTVKSVTDLIDDNPFPGLVDYPSYIQPSDLAQVEVEISYGSQKASVYFKYAYCNDRYYIYDVDDTEYDIDFSDYKFSNKISSDELSDLFANNTITVEGEKVGELFFL